MFAGLCRSDTPFVQSAGFVIKSDYLPSATLIRILFVAAYTVRLFLHNWSVIQSYLCDWYGPQRERPSIRTEVEIVWNIVPSGSVALSVIKRGENVMKWITLSSISTAVHWFISLYSPFIATTGSIMNLCTIDQLSSWFELDRALSLVIAEVRIRFPLLILKLFFARIGWSLIYEDHIHSHVREKCLHHGGVKERFACVLKKSRC